MSSVKEDAYIHFRTKMHIVKSQDSTICIPMDSLHVLCPDCGVEVFHIYYDYRT